MGDLPDEEVALIQGAENQSETDVKLEEIPIEPDTKSELKPTESVIKRGVPKTPKPAPAVVAIKMVDLLAAPDNQHELVADDSAGPTDTQNANPDVELKLEKELAKQAKLKKEEEAKAKKEQERLFKLQKQEQQKQEKLKREEEAEAKKQKEMGEKRQKKEKQMLEKAMKEDAAKAKKEDEMRDKQQKQEKEKLEKLKKEQAKKEEEITAKQQKQEKEKLEKLKKQEARETNEKTKNYGEEKTIKRILDDERKLDAAEESLPAGTEETAGTDTMKIILEDGRPEGQSVTKPTESVIKRGVPKNTKPAPAVVAIKMVDLLTVPDEKLDNTNADMPDHNQQNNVEQSQQNCADPTQQKLLEKQSQDEKLRLEKEMKLHEKLKKEQEA